MVYIYQPHQNWILTVFWPSENGKKRDFEVHPVSEEGSPTSSKILFLQRGLLKTISSNTSPYNPILVVPGLQKNAKNAKNAHKKAGKSIFWLSDMEGWGVPAHTIAWYRSMWALTSTTISASESHILGSCRSKLHFSPRPFLAKSLKSVSKVAPWRGWAGPK